MWRFNLIPEEQHAEVLDHYREGRWKELLTIYNRHRVSPDALTTCCAYELIMEWTQYAIDEGWIR